MPDSKTRGESAIAAATGAFGILSGFAVFLLWWQEAEEGNPWRFVFGLFVASGVTFIIESLRDKIYPHHENGEQRTDDKGKVDSHHEIGDHDTDQKWSSLLKKLPVSVAMVVIYELFVTAYHEASGKLSAQTLSAAVNGIVGHKLAGALPPQATLAALVVVWIAIGAGLSWCLSMTIRLTGKLTQRSAVGAVCGGVAGVVGAPVIVVGAVLLARCVGMICWMVVDYGAWKLNLDAIAKTETWGLVFWPLKALATTFESLWYDGGAIFLGIGILIWGGVLYRNWNRDNHIRVYAIWFAGSIFALLSVPILDDLKPVFMLALLASVVWLVPGLGMGLLVPWLQPPSEAPKTWGIVCLLGAFSLAAVTFLRLQLWEWCAVPAVILGVTGVFFLGVTKPKAYWPFLALSTAAVLFGSTQLLHATFGSAFQYFHQSLGIPLTAKIADSPVVGFDDNFPDPLVNSEVELRLTIREKANADREPQGVHDFSWESSGFGGLSKYAPAEVKQVRDDVIRGQLADPNVSKKRKAEIEAAIQKWNEQEAGRAKQWADAQSKRQAREARMSRLSKEELVLGSDALNHQFDHIEERAHELQALADNPTVGLRQKLEAVEEERPFIESDIQLLEGEVLFIGAQNKLGWFDNQTDKWVDYESSGLSRYLESEKDPLADPCATSEKPGYNATPAERFSCYRYRLAASQTLLNRIDVELRNSVWQCLELALTGSFGFWTTAGLLAVWASAKKA